MPSTTRSDTHASLVQPDQHNNHTLVTPRSAPPHHHVAAAVKCKAAVAARTPIPLQLLCLLLKLPPTRQAYWVPGSVSPLLLLLLLVVCDNVGGPRLGMWDCANIPEGRPDASQAAAGCQVLLASAVPPPKPALLPVLCCAHGWQHMQAWSFLTSQLVTNATSSQGQTVDPRFP
jgi:hypothetical protein